MSDICWNFDIPLVCRVACVQLAHSSLGNWKDICVTHLIVIKLEVSTFPIVVIFFLLLCVGGGCTIIFCHLLHMCLGGAETLFPLLMCSLWCVQMIRYILRPAGCVPSFAHYSISLSSLCRHIWRNCTSHRLVRYMLSSVCLRLSPFSPFPPVGSGTPAFRLGSRIDPHRHRGVVKVHWRVPWVGGLFSWVVATFTL